MENDIGCNTNQNNGGLAILRSDKTHFRAKRITKN